MLPPEVKQLRFSVHYRGHRVEILLAEDHMSVSCRPGGTSPIRIRVGDELFTLDPLSSALVEPDEVRQVFNDTGADALWLVVGTPPELANTLEMTPGQLADLYPDGPRALPPELA